MLQTEHSQDSLHFHPLTTSDIVFVKYYFTIIKIRETIYGFI